jgi:hypothetical protein
MLEEARDISAICFLERRLGALREEYLSAMIEGKSILPGYLHRCENAILEEMKREYYNQNIRQLVKSSAASTLSDKEDFANHSQKLAEEATLIAHRKLACIPFIGQAEYREA